MRASDILLIGVDGGATEVKAHTVCCDNLEAPSVFELGPGKAARKYERHSDFQPLPIADQLTQRKSGRLELDDAERRQGDLWVQACIDAIADAASDSRCDGLLIGVDMPGLKTDDGRGIDAINHGPRIPDYLEHLEHELPERGIKLAAPIAALGSDADYCGLGEQFASGGLFRDVDHAYYLGGGTGLADALKLGGELIPFDRAASWILKSWEMPSTLGSTFEQLISARAINAMYADMTPGTAQGVYPEVAAARGDRSAAACLDRVAGVLAELIFSRVDTIKNGGANIRHSCAGRRRLSDDHPYRGTILDRVVIGQRLGLIYSNPDYRPFFAEPVERYLAKLIAESNDRALQERWLCDGKVRPGLIRGSVLRAAPALGAAVAAARAYAFSPNA